MQAARVLEEVSSKDDALAHTDGRLFLTDKHIGWLNQILGTDFKTRSAGDIQKVLRLYPKDALEDKCMEFFRLYGKRPEPCTAEPVSTCLLYTSSRTGSCHRNADQPHQECCEIA